MLPKRAYILVAAGHTLLGWHAVTLLSQNGENDASTILGTARRREGSVMDVQRPSLSFVLSCLCGDAALHIGAQTRRELEHAALPTLRTKPVARPAFRTSTSFSAFKISKQQHTVHSFVYGC
jgi:hypothetical protein